MEGRGLYWHAGHLEPHFADTPAECRAEQERDRLFLLTAPPKNRRLKRQGDGVDREPCARQGAAMDLGHQGCACLASQPGHVPCHITVIAATMCLEMPSQCGFRQAIPREHRGNAAGHCCALPVKGANISCTASTVEAYTHQPGRACPGRATKPSPPPAAPLPPSFAVEALSSPSVLLRLRADVAGCSITSSALPSSFGPEALPNPAALILAELLRLGAELADSTVSPSAPTARKQRISVQPQKLPWRV